MNTKKNPKATEPKDRIIRSVVMPPDLDRELQAMADREDRSLSNMIMRAVREMVDRSKAQKG
jgi:predicted transcriptional regulator